LVLLLVRKTSSLDEYWAWALESITSTGSAPDLELLVRRTTSLDSYGAWSLVSYISSSGSAPDLDDRTWDPDSYNVRAFSSAYFSSGGQGRFGACSSGSASFLGGCMSFPTPPAFGGVVLIVMKLGSTVRLSSCEEGEKSRDG